jgi:copper/silver efflux system protein
VKSCTGSTRSRTEAGTPCPDDHCDNLLALLPILTSSGSGADIMIPMAIPAFGGMTIALITLFLVPVLFTAWNEYLMKNGNDEQKSDND